MEVLPVWVYIILALFAGLFGNQFLGRFIEARLKQKGQLSLAEREREVARDRAEQQQQNELLKAVVGMVQTQSKDLTELLKDSLKSNQVMANNIGQLAMAIEGQGRDTTNRFVLVKQGLDEVSDDLEAMTRKLDVTNDYTAAVIRAIGGNLESILADVQRDKDAGKGLESD